MPLPNPFLDFPKHLHHASKPPVIANDRETEAAAREDGYVDEYQHKEYPCVLNGMVADLEEQAEAASNGFLYAGPVDAPFPHAVSRTINSIEDDPRFPKNTGVVAPALEAKAVGDAGPEA